MRFRYLRSFFGYKCGKLRREITLLDTLMVAILVIILLGV
ncbi:hypothetical protein BTJ44_03475 [Bacillus mycoides]|nr:hypothetical protein BTJ44_03475 [Bacillus mycoides]